MRLLRCLPLALLLLCPAFADQAPTDQHKYSPVKAMSQEEFDQQFKSEKSLVFELASPDGIVDERGLLIRARYIEAYLNERKVEADMSYLLLITSASPKLDTVAGTVEPLGNHGAKTIAFKHKVPSAPRQQTGVFTPASGPTPEPKKKVMIYGKPNANSLIAGQAFPDLNGRPEALRPEALPQNSRYKFSADKEMIDAAAMLESHLISQTGVPGESLFKGDVILDFSIWRLLGSDPGLGKVNSQPYTIMGKVRNSIFKGHGMTIRDPKERQHLESRLREIIAANNGAIVRALRTEEMARLWPYLSFDIIEPVLVLVTKNGLHHFVFHISPAAVLVNDIDGLPRD